jgi:hypothetical protein
MHAHGVSDIGLRSRPRDDPVAAATSQRVGIGDVSVGPIGIYFRT